MKSHTKAPVYFMIVTGVGLVLLSLASLAWLALPSQSARSGQQAEKSSASVIPQPVDFEAPALNLQDLQGEPVALSDYAGQYVLVNNWATWCPPCKAEMPVLQAYYDTHQHKGFTIIAIEAGEPLDQVAAFAASYKLTFPVWADPQQVAMKAFRNFSLPSSYLVDPDGRVRLAWTGAISMQMLEKYVTPFLGR
jgi:peroxiredoxin